MLNESSGEPNSETSETTGAGELTKEEARELISQNLQGLMEGLEAAKWMSRQHFPKEVAQMFCFLIDVLGEQVMKVTYLFERLGSVENEVGKLQAGIRD